MREITGRAITERAMRAGGVVFSMLLFLITAAVPGCCPLGDDVLSGLTLLPEEQTDGCKLHSSPSIVGDPLELLGDDLTRIPDRSTSAALIELTGSPGADGQVPERVEYAYAAEYACGSGDGTVGVAAVMFADPTGADRAVRLEASPMEVIYRGQLAAIVWTRGPECDDCYRKIRARAEKSIGREE